MVGPGRIKERPSRSMEKEESEIIPVTPSAPLIIFVYSNSNLNLNRHKMTTSLRI